MEVPDIYLVLSEIKCFWKAEMSDEITVTGGCLNTNVHTNAFVVATKVLHREQLDL